MKMKATGIVRRVDDLGRVVIPKEIRRQMRIREGEPLEIFVDNEGSVIFRKYNFELIGEVKAMKEHIDSHLDCGDPQRRAEARKHFDAIVALLADDECED